MNALATKKTILRLSTKNVLNQHTETQHISARFKDIGYGSDGKPVTLGTATTVLKDSQTVSRVSIDRDYDGNLFITLEE
jgi:hypothetical protein